MGEEADRLRHASGGVVPTLDREGEHRPGSAQLTPDEPLGIALGDNIEGDYSTLAQVRDPDGNLLTLATPPSRPFPAA